MNVSQESTANPRPRPRTSPVTMMFGMLALAVSLISMALTLTENMGVGATAALIAADLVLIAAMGVLCAVVRHAAVPGMAAAAAEPSQRRDEELLDALEPLRPAAGSSGGGR
ncbi:hypothetical protein ABZX75_25100 [Streptomyces sp. NPDC003038]|uniref:hypothetical protein n=1 Tax=unclassified Streptomyces TaxID=2593676 RepID=UPI0033BC274C